jgi:hypothetical protein
LSTPRALTYRAYLAANANGQAVVTWLGYTPDWQQVFYGQRLDAAGNLVGGPFPIQTPGAGMGEGAVTVAADGSFAVTWGDPNNADGSAYGVYGRFYDANGNSLSGPTILNTYTANNQLRPAVAADGQGYVVTWDSLGQDGSGYGVYARRFGPDGTPRDAAEFPVNTTTAGDQADTSVAADAAGNFLVLWYADDGSQQGFWGQRYGNGTDVVPPTADAVLAPDRTAIPAGAYLYQKLGGITVDFSESLSAAVSNPASWSLTRNGTDVSSTITGIAFALNPTTHRYEATLSFAAPLGSGAYVVGLSPVVTDAAGNALDGDRDGVAGGAWQFAVTAADALPGDEIPINQYVAGEQVNPTVARNGAGRTVVVWNSAGEDGSGWGVYARIYDAAGQPVTDEFRVNQYTASDQYGTRVVMDAAGNFWVGWYSYGQDGSGWGAFMRKFNAAGQPLTDDLLVNQNTGGDQTETALSVNPAGQVVATLTAASQRPRSGRSTSASCARKATTLRSAAPRGTTASRSRRRPTPPPRYWCRSTASRRATGARSRRAARS